MLQAERHNCTVRHLALCKKTIWINFPMILICRYCQETTCRLELKWSFVHEFLVETNPAHFSLSINVEMNDRIIIDYRWMFCAAWTNNFSNFGTTPCPMSTPCSLKTRVRLKNSMKIDRMNDSDKLSCTDRISGSLKVWSQSVKKLFSSTEWMKQKIVAVLRKKK